MSVRGHAFAESRLPLDSSNWTNTFTPSDACAPANASTSSSADTSAHTFAFFSARSSQIKAEQIAWLLPPNTRENSFKNRSLFK